ncbi:MAG: hypothetical protein R2853_13795 [Thermomicrobiales bacterium]|nr:hypothetical protein [Thermomicrobiales bacterium]
MSNQPLELAAAPVAGLDIQALSPAEPATECDGLRKPSHVPAFMLGTVFGALAGALLGTLISPHTRAYLVGLYQLASRRLTSAERDKLRFELLLQ